MAIQFHPRPATVLICNFETGFVPPEMVKPRRVIVISPKKFNNLGTCMVVPVSKTPPNEAPPLHIQFPAGKYHFFHRDFPCWAKCNMVYSVSLQRLDRLRVGTEYLTPSITELDLRLVRRTVAFAAGIDLDCLRDL